MTDRERLRQAIDSMEKTEICLDVFDRALAARERAVWEAAAKLCEHEYDASHDREAVVYECLLTIAGLCRHQAEAVKP